MYLPPKKMKDPTLYSLALTVVPQESPGSSRSLLQDTSRTSTTSNSAAKSAKSKSSSSQKAESPSPKKGKFKIFESSIGLAQCILFHQPPLKKS